MHGGMRSVYSQFEALGSGAVAGFPGFDLTQSASASAGTKEKNIKEIHSAPHKIITT